MLHLPRIRDKLVPDTRDLSMAGVKSYYADRIKAQCVHHLSQSVSEIRNKEGFVVARVKLPSVARFKVQSVTGI